MLHFGTEPRYILHASSPIVVDYCIQYEQNHPFFSVISQHSFFFGGGKFLSYSNWTLNQVLFYTHEQHVLSDYCMKYDPKHQIHTKYEENPFSHHGEMCEASQTDRARSYTP